jgi:hypothetical protein
MEKQTKLSVKSGEEPCYTADGSGMESGPATAENSLAGPQTIKPRAPGMSTVRNIFKILGCHKTDDTTQKSTGKTKFTSAEGCTPGILGGTHPGREDCRGFIRRHAPSPAPGSGRFWAHSLHGWLIRKGPGWEQTLGTKKFKSSGKQ